MEFLPLILIFIFFISLILSLLSFYSTKTSFQIVKEMGLGYNLANLFDCYNISKEITEPNDQITLCGNSIPTKDIIKNIKKNGFKTIRFPVTWMHFIDDTGKVNPKWMERVIEVVDWIIDFNLYCILNIHNDGIYGNWLNEGISAKNKYIYLWSQIAETFKRYDEHLIFESMKEIEYRNGDFNEYLNIVFNFTQAFVDTIRSSEGYNKDRLLLVSGIRMNIDYTCSLGYRMPTDLSNKLAISIIYLYPSSFTITNDDNPTITIMNGQIYETVGVTSWGTDSDYTELVSNFNTMKAAFLDKGIPVILTEVGVFTEQKKRKNFD